MKNYQDCNEYFWKVPYTDVMEFCEVSQATARRSVKEINEQLKIERDAKILELHEEGMKQQQIADEINASLGSVNKIINESFQKCSMSKNENPSEPQIPSQSTPTDGSYSIPTSTQEEREKLLTPKGEQQAHKGYEECTECPP